MSTKAATRREPSPKRVIDTLLTPVQDFIKTESSSGIILILAAALAFAWANSPWSAGYFELLGTRFGIAFGGWGLEKDLSHWVNDLLMAVFFFLVGLEMKREVMVGELVGWKKASLPVSGAIGGMVVPALIYWVINAGEPTVQGWGVPMATDIAFALGVLALLGDRVPSSLKIFLLALAIVDDLGAVLVIALFYTPELNTSALLLSLLVWVLAMLYGRFGGAKPIAFAAIGLIMWYFMLKSGVHATIAGVLMAFAVPLRHEINQQQLKDELRPLLGQGQGFEQVEVVIEHLERVLAKAHSPLHSMEHGLAPYVAFLIMPVFAFFNAGVAVFGGEANLLSAASIGAFLGLVIGKPLGVVGFVWVAVAVGITSLPRGANWSGMIGIGLLSGIGFTMSLFIAYLAFGPTPALDEVKIGVLAASVVAALGGGSPSCALGSPLQISR